MQILRKLKTARKVLFKNGFSQVLFLLLDKIEALIIHFSRRLGSFFHSAVTRLFPRRKKNAVRPFDALCGGRDRLRILYVTSLVEAECGQTVRYRIFNYRKALSGVARTRFEIIENGGLKGNVDLEWADIIVLMRLEWTDQVESLIKRAKACHKPVVFDVDDIVFLSEYTGSFCKAIGDSREKTFNHYQNYFRTLEKTFEHCDYATASTPFIVEKMIEKGKKAFLINNGLNDTQLKIAVGIRNRKPKNASVKYLAYLSGSKTHDRDFRQALPAIIRIMKEYGDVKLRLAGYLDVENFPPELSERVETAIYMKYTRLLKYSSGNFINLAPLDTENPFCHAKSELKYFEAAVVGVPTIASPTDTFIRCIQNYDNGILASTEEEWYHALKTLIEDQTLYEDIVKSAYSHAIVGYSPEAIGRQAAEAYMKIAQFYHSDKSR